MMARDLLASVQSGRLRMTAAVDVGFRSRNDEAAFVLLILSLAPTPRCAWQLGGRYRYGGLKASSLALFLNGEGYPSTCPKPCTYTLRDSSVAPDEAEHRDYGPDVHRRTVSQLARSTFITPSISPRLSASAVVLAPAKAVSSDLIVNMYLSVVMIPRPLFRLSPNFEVSV